MNVLFIGNSHTFVNNLPATVEAFCAAQGIDFHAGRFLRGGASFKDHLMDNAGQSEGRENPAAEELLMPLDPNRVGGLDALLAEREWDVAVLQCNSQEPIWRPEDFLHYGPRLAEHCRRGGVAKIALYVTWAWRDFPQWQMTVTGYTTDLAAKIDAFCVPSGEAFALVRRERTDVELFAEDGAHASPAGTYLSACCFYATLTGQSPVGLPTALPDVMNHHDPPTPSYADLDETLARDLQVFADRTVTAWREQYPQE